MEHEWQINTGVVPEGVGPDTVIEVEYRDGIVIVWDLNYDYPLNNDPDIWSLDDYQRDVIRWRFV